MVAAQMKAGENDGIFAGCDGYRCTKYMMTPLGTPFTPGQRRYNKPPGQRRYNKPPGQRRYNKPLARTRNPIERTLGMLRAKILCLILGMSEDQPGEMRQHHHRSCCPLQHSRFRRGNQAGR